MQKTLIVILLFLHFGSFSQSIQKKLTQVDGLASYNIRHIIQDLNGFLWICTQDGLSKFDGVNFTNYTNSAANRQHRIDFSDCRSLFIDTVKNRLWVMGADAGMDVIDCNTGNIVERHLNDFGSSDNWLVTCKRIDKEVWIGSNNGLWVFDMRTNIYKRVALPKSNFLQRINTLSVDGYGHVFVFVNGFGLFVVDAKTKVILSKNDRFLSKSDDKEFDFLASLIVSEKLFIGSSIGLHYYEIDKFGNLKQLPLAVQALLIDKPVKDISIIGEDIYISSQIFISLKKDITSYSILSENIDDNWISKINTVCSLTNDLLALGCNAGLVIFAKSQNAIKAITNDEKKYNNKLKHLFGVNPLLNGTVLSATQNGLFEVGSKKYIKTIEADGYFQNICRIDYNETLVSYKDGSKLYKNSKLIPIEKIYSEFYEYKNWRINGCLKFNDSLFILSAENNKGILVWNKKRKSVFNINASSNPVKIRSNAINSIFIDTKQKIWVLSDFSISLLDLHLKTCVDVNIFPSNTKLSSGLFFDMVEVNGEYWIASYGLGILILDKQYKLKNVLSQNGGLCNNGVYKIFVTGNAVFVSSNNGISKIDATTFKIKNLFYPNDGLHGNSFEEACGVQVDGIIYFGGLDGFTKIDPSKFRFNKAPPLLFFEEINIETTDKKIDTSNLFLKNLSIPNNVTQTKITFIGINYQNPTNVNYWYKISELGSKWIDLKNQNFITLIGIAPGKYHLQVKAENEDGVECAAINMDLHFLPKWYQTLLFKILVTLSLATLLFVLYSFRIRQLKKVLAVRQKISRNLHDDIGSTLSAINMYTQAAKLQQQENDFMNSIEENTQDALGKLDDIIWSTNPKNDKIKNLVERMDGFARPLLQAKNIKFNFIHSNIINEQKIGEATRQNLFVIFKEAINNVVKYADCTTCTVVLEEKNRNICCAITDDGKGFNVTKPTERNGILNMQLRAKEMKGNFNIVSISSQGTTIKVQLPV